MNLQLNNKVALVTGSSRGIGLGIAQALHEEGCTVILNSRSDKDLQLCRDQFKDRVDTFSCDVTNLEECKKLKEFVEAKYQRLDILVLNVGTGRSVPNGQETAADWSQSFQINFDSVTRPIEAMRTLFAKSSTVVTMISSICGVEFLPAPATYSAAKAALHSYSKSLSRSMASYGSRVNVVAPGNILFDGSTWQKKLLENRLEVEKYIEQEVPLKKFGTAQDVGSLVAFLSSPRASFITGASFIVDGGQTRSFI